MESGQPESTLFCYYHGMFRAHFSAIWIVVANAWMQTPAGFHIVGEGIAARAEITDFWEMVFNPSSVIRLLHTIVGAWLAGAFLVISVSAYYTLKGRNGDLAKNSLNAGLIVALVSLVLQLILGDLSGKIVAKHQPMKLAALEGVYHTQKGAPLTLWGVPNSNEKEVNYAIRIPQLLSFIAAGDVEAEIAGLDKVPRKDWPNVPVVFQTYRLMLLSWLLMVIVAVLGLVLVWRGTLYQHRFALKLMVISVLFPQIGNQAGWVSAEMGRYPWIVQDLLRISDGLSKTVTANQVLTSIIMFSFVYLLLFILFIFLLNDKIKNGPEGLTTTETYHDIQKVLGEGKNGLH